MFPPSHSTGSRNLLRLGLLTLGLTFAACGSQADVAVSTTTSTTTSTTAVAVTDTLLEAEAETPPEESELGSEDADAEAPPLALTGEFVELPSALPEVALDGVGEPLGAEPISIGLPTLGIDTAPIVPVGLEANGELEVPEADTVGWYEFGAGIGGGQGSTVLAAHIAYNGENGVFIDLVDMVPGQIITVDHEGERLEYVVESVTDYDKWELPIDELFSEEGPEQIVLITCGGSFNPDLASYEDNTVVVATPA